LLKWMLGEMASVIVNIALIVASTNAGAATWVIGRQKHIHACITHKALRDIANRYNAPVDCVVPLSCRFLKIVINSW
jgi:hypothetical protein